MFCRGCIGRSGQKQAAQAQFQNDSKFSHVPSSCISSFPSVVRHIGSISPQSKFPYLFLSIENDTGFL
jgi:hypothetical protein